MKRYRSRLRAIVVAAMASITLDGAASAEPVTFRFTGIVTSIDAGLKVLVKEDRVNEYVVKEEVVTVVGDESGLTKESALVPEKEISLPPMDGSVVVGSPVTGFYRFDATTQDNLDAAPLVARYPHVGPVYGMSVTVGNYTFHSFAPDLEFDVYVDAGWGIYVAEASARGSYLAPTGQGLLSSGVWIELSRSGSGFASDALPLAPPSPAAFANAAGAVVVHEELTCAPPYECVVPGSGFIRFRVTSLTPNVREVAIDIKPGSDPNSVNLDASGVIPVAILSSPTFDARDVDAATVTLAGAAVKLIGKGSRYFCNPEDVNGDGLIDLVCHVMTAQFMIEPGDSHATLEAKTFAGEAIRGTDSVRVVR